MSHHHGHGHHVKHALTEVLLDVEDTAGRLPYEAVVDAAIVEVKATHRLRQVFSLIFALDIAATLFFMFGGVCHFNLDWSTFTTRLLTTNSTTGFSIRTSTIDVVLVDGIKWIVLFIFFMLGRLCCQTKKIQYHQDLLQSMHLQDKATQPSSSGFIVFQSVGWWLLFFSTMWSITKVGMLDWSSGWHVSHPWKMWCVVFAALFSVFETKYTHDLLVSQNRAFELRTLLLTDLSTMQEQNKDTDETKTNNLAPVPGAESNEDPRSRFYEDPEKKRIQLLKPQSTMSFYDSFKGLWTIMRAYVWPSGCSSKCRIFLTFVVMAGSKASAILAPMYIGEATQTLADEKKVPYHAITMYCTLQFLNVGLAQVQKIVYLGVKQHAFAEIATTTFRHLHSLSLDWHLQKKMGTVLRIMDRGIASADQVMNYLVLYLLPSIVQAFVVFGLFYVKFNSAELAGAAFLSFVVYCVVTIQITMWRKKFRKATNKHDNKYHDLATDSLINFETVKYFANEEHEIKNFRESVEQYQKHNIATQISLAVLNSAQQLDIQITTTIALMLSATTILHASGTLDLSDSTNIGAFVSVNAYILQLYAPLSFLGSIYSTVVQAFVDMGNLSEMLTVAPDVRDVNNAPPLRLNRPKMGAKIEFQNVKFSYPSQPSKGLKGVSFTVEPGTTTAIVGPTGAGKSTVSRLLFRFYDTTSGSIYVRGQTRGCVSCSLMVAGGWWLVTGGWWLVAGGWWLVAVLNLYSFSSFCKVDNQDISKVTQKSLRSSIGVVPQDTVLFNSTIQHNIQYGNVHADFELLQQAAKSAQILPFIESLEETWDTMVGERGLKISGGEKQRVAIARCLLKNPPIVLLDEATSALDSQTEVMVKISLPPVLTF